MQTVTFLKEPGYTYDLIGLFCVYFNREVYISQMAIPERLAEDTEHYNRILEELGSIPEELRAFFHVHMGQTPFFPKYYYNFHSERDICDYNVQTILEELSDCDTVIDRMIQFYFPTLSDEEIAQGKGDLTKIDQWIRGSSYADQLKTALYTFFISPINTIHALIRELMAKELWLAKYYEDNMQVLAGLKENCDYQFICASLKMGTEQSADIDEYSKCYISFCLINHYCVVVEYGDDCGLFLLGADYGEYLRIISRQRKAVRLDAFGGAMSEKNRVEILNLMRDRGEVAIKDIEQELGFTGTNTYYHLSLMIKAGMLKTRNKGRTVLYSINDHFFDVLCDILKGYSKTERGEKI